MSIYIFDISFFIIFVVSVQLFIPLTASRTLTFCRPTQVAHFKAFFYIYTFKKGAKNPAIEESPEPMRRAELMNCDGTCVTRARKSNSQRFAAKIGEF